MSGLITSAHVCGSLGQALAVVDGQTWLYEGAKKHIAAANDIKFFFDFGLEIEAIDASLKKKPGEEELLLFLSAQTRRFRALQGLLVGMDGKLSRDSRIQSMRIANSALVDATVRNFIERRFLKPTETQQWDIPGARQLAIENDLSGAGRLYSIVDGPLILSVESEVASWAFTQSLSSIERRDVVERAYESGLISTFAASLFDGNKDRLRTTLFFGARTGDRRLVAHLIRRLAYDEITLASIPTTEQDDQEFVDKTDLLVAIRSQIEQGLAKYRKQRDRHKRLDFDRSNFDALDPVLRQIDWIVSRFMDGRAHSAWNAISGIVQRQLQISGPDRLAMTLTNLASQLTWDHEAALALLELAHTCAPHDSTVQCAKAEVFRSSGRLDEALTGYERTIELFPQEVIARNGRAEVLRECGRLDEALFAYDQNIEMFPQDTVARNGRAETLRSLGRFDDALTAYERNIDLFPKDVVARNGRAEVLRAWGRLNEALAAYERAIELFPQDVFSQNGRAEVLRAWGRLDEALAAYERTIELFPQNVSARNGHAETLRAAGRLDQALGAYERTIELFPRDAFAWSGRAEVLRAWGRLDDALAAYDQALESFPRHATIRTGRAECLRSLGRPDEALEAYDRTIELFPKDIASRTGRAETLRALGRLDDALASYERTIELFPHDIVARSGRAEVLRARGRLDEALVAYLQAIELFPQDVIARSGRAEVLRAAGRLDEALVAYQQTIEMFPEDVIARNGRAQTLRALGRLDEALLEYQALTAKFPYSSFSRVGQAIVLGELDRFQEALALLAFGDIPRTSGDWVEAHVRCTIELRMGVNSDLVRRIETYSATCPLRNSGKYFETTLAVARIAMKSTRDAKRNLESLTNRSDFDAEERGALELMIAHVEAAEGNIAVARQALADISSVVPYERFRNLQQLRNEILRRLDLEHAEPRPSMEHIKLLDTKLTRLELDFWVGRAIVANGRTSLAA